MIDTTPMMLSKKWMEKKSMVVTGSLSKGLARESPDVPLGVLNRMISALNVEKGVIGLMSAKDQVAGEDIVHPSRLAHVVDQEEENIEEGDTDLAVILHQGVKEEGDLLPASPPDRAEASLGEASLGPQT